MAVAVTGFWRHPQRQPQASANLQRAIGSPDDGLRRASGGVGDGADPDIDHRVEHGGELAFRQQPDQQAVDRPQRFRRIVAGQVDLGQQRVQAEGVQRRRDAMAGEIAQKHRKAVIVERAGAPDVAAQFRTGFKMAVESNGVTPLQPAARLGRRQQVELHVARQGHPLDRPGVVGLQAADDLLKRAVERAVFQMDPQPRRQFRARHRARDQIGGPGPHQRLPLPRSGKPTKHQNRRVAHAVHGAQTGDQIQIVGQQPQMQHQQIGRALPHPRQQPIGVQRDIDRPHANAGQGRTQHRHGGGAGMADQHALPANRKGRRRSRRATL